MIVRILAAASLSLALFTNTGFAELACPEGLSGPQFDYYEGGVSGGANLQVACFNTVASIHPTYVSNHNGAQAYCVNNGGVFVTDFPGTLDPGFPNGTGGTACDCHQLPEGDWQCVVNVSAHWKCCTEGEPMP